MTKTTIQTIGGNFIDVVDSALEVESPFYILQNDVDTISEWMSTNGYTVITNAVAKKLIDNGWLKRNEVPF